MFYATVSRIASQASSRPRPTEFPGAWLCLHGPKLSVYSLLFLVFTSSTFAGPVTLAWDPSSGPNLAGYMLYYGSARGSYSVGVDVGNLTTAAISGLQEGGTYYFVATAYDVYGDESPPSNEVSYTIPMANDTPPAVALITPLNGASVARKSTVTIGANASDDVGVTKVEFYVNGSLICTDSTGSYTCAWKVPAVSGRSYQLQAKAYDTAGKVGSSSIVSVVSQ
jgi:chitinase